MLIMGKLRNLYTKYATIDDLLHNDIVMPNESFHLLLEDLGYTMEPLVGTLGIQIGLRGIWVHHVQ